LYSNVEKIVERQLIIYKAGILQHFVQLRKLSWATKSLWGPLAICCAGLM